METGRNGMTRKIKRNAILAHLAAKALFFTPRAFPRYAHGTIVFRVQGGPREMATHGRYLPHILAAKKTSQCPAMSPYYSL